MKIGYARVSTDEQTLDLQLDALKQAGCQRVFSDVISGAKSERAGFAEALDFLRAGDTLAVWRLDRLGRSLRYLIDAITLLSERDIGFQSLTEQIDTTTPGGKLIFHIFGALAEFERDVIRERTRAGLAAARARGRNGGRPKAKSFNTTQKVAVAHRMYTDKSNTIAEICDALGVSRATLYRYLKGAPDDGASAPSGENTKVAVRRLRNVAPASSHSVEVLSV